MYRSRRGMGATLSDLAGAITRFEGSCSSPGVCRNNNPGNLRTPGSGYWPGQTGIDSRGFAVFDSFDSGQAALISQEQYNINRGLSLSEFFGGKPGVYPGYAPSADSNDPGSYSKAVAGWIGISPDVPLSSVIDGAVAPILTPADSTDAGNVVPAGDGLSSMAWLGIGLLGVGVAVAMAN